jgi:Tol biopolymer transport system component
LTSGTEDVEPDCSPDGQWVVYVAKEPSGAASIWKVSIEGGQPLRLTTDCGTTPSPAISPDGKRLAHFRLIFDRNEKRLEIIPFDHSGPSDARAQGSFTLPNTAYFPRWSHDGRSILHLQAEGRVANLWALSLESGERRQLTRFSSEEISRFALSLDGQQVALCRIKTIRDVVRISNFT